MNALVIRMLIAPLLVALSAAAADSVTVVYTNFGPSMAFDTDPFHGWTINGFLGANIGQQAISQRFTPASSTTFVSAQIAMSLGREPGVVDVYLQEDLNGMPGAIIERIPVGGLTLTTPITASILAATSMLRPPLTKDVSYWLTVVAGADGMLGGWNWNSIGDIAAFNFASTQGGSPAGPWGIGVGNTRSVFQINGPASTPFAAFGASVEVKTLRMKSEAEGQFTLGDTSDGIDPSAQDVTFQIGSFSGLIPKGSFLFDPVSGAFTFGGSVGGVPVEAVIAQVPAMVRTFTFELELKGVDAAARANAVTVQLAIGNDNGTTSAPVESRAR